MITNHWYWYGFNATPYPEKLLTLLNGLVDNENGTLN